MEEKTVKTCQEKSLKQWVIANQLQRKKKPQGENLCVCLGAEGQKAWKFLGIVWPNNRYKSFSFPDWQKITLGQRWWPHLGSRGRWVCEFKSSLVYWVSSRTQRDKEAHQETLSRKKKINKQKKKKTMVLSCSRWHHWSNTLCYFIAIYFCLAVSLLLIK